MKMDPKKYKAFHEATMANNPGTTIEHCFMVVLVTVLSMVMTVIGRQNRSRRFQILIEYFGFILPLVFGFTVLSKYIIEITKSIIVIICIQSFLYMDHASAHRSFKRLNVFRYPRMECVTNVRAATYIITVFTILAVDFSSFNRVLAKTERYGYSLMDLGVGFYTMASGLVHKRYANPQISVIIKDNYKLMLVPILGLMRYFLVKSIDYHEHVTEYGVHWNFFYTLTVAKLTSIFILHYTPPKYDLLMCAVVLLTHQVFLECGLERWVFSDVARDSFLNANREGIASSLGYVFLYLFGSYIKTVLTNRVVMRGRVLFKLSVFWILSFLIIFHTNILGPVSRTLANAGYCILVVASFMFIIVVFYMVEVILDEYQVSSALVLSEAFNRNGLFLFVLSNVITGLINISFQTLLLKDSIALLILNTYMICVICVAVFLHSKNITLL